MSSENRTVWLVELFHNGKSEGWWTKPNKDNGGWRTDNAWAAGQYTESEAKEVAAALDYFPTPFRWSHWVATEHIFYGVDNYVRRADGPAPAGEPQARRILNEKSAAQSENESLEKGKPQPQAPEETKP